MGSVPGLITATELAVEVERLKQLISAQIHFEDDDSHDSDAEELAGYSSSSARLLKLGLEFVNVHKQVFPAVGLTCKRR